MSTSLMTFAVLSMAIGTAVAIALAEPDQPATLRRHRRRDQRRSGPRPGPAAGSPRAGENGHGSINTVAAARARLHRRPGRARHGQRWAPLTEQATAEATLAPVVPEARLIPASPAAGHHRTLLQDTAVTTPLHLADSWVLAPPTPWWHRVWSGVALTMIIVALGTVMAAAFAAVVMLIAVGFQQIFA